MFIVFLLLWFLAAIVLKTDNNKTNRWICYFSICCGFGGLSVFLEQSVLNHVGVKYEYPLRMVIGICGAIAYYLGPISLFMFGIYYSGKTEGKPKLHIRVLVFIIFIPAVLMCIFYPLEPEFNPPYAIMSLWTVPYMTIPNWMIYKVYKNERNMNLKRKKFITLLALTPTSMTANITSFVFVALELPRVWQYNVYIIVFQFIVFLYLAYKDGVLGIAVKIEKDNLDSTMKALDTGIAILNHTLKNEILKISMSNDNIKSYCNLSDNNVNESF